MIECACKANHIGNNVEKAVFILVHLIISSRIKTFGIHIEIRKFAMICFHMKKNPLTYKNSV